MIPALLPRQAETADDGGWQACLALVFAQHGSNTVLEHSRHYGPLRIQRPFYPEGNLAHVYILHPPGGVVG
ncbi:Urease accessory protein UreD, partial [hydrothermal vent metagenome]